jgi:hypothetical protein
VALVVLVELDSLMETVEDSPVELADTLVAVELVPQLLTSLAVVVVLTLHQPHLALQPLLDFTTRKAHLTA